MSTLRTVLEQSIVEEFEELANHAAFADYLLDQADIADQHRGEFIRIQLSLEQEATPPGQRSILKQREEELLRLYWNEWLGRLTSHVSEEVSSDNSRPASTGEANITIQFARGWIVEARVNATTMRPMEDLVSSPLARCLQRVTIKEGHDDWYGWWDEGQQTVVHETIPEGTPQDNSYLVPLFNAPFLTTIKSFQVGVDPKESATMLHARADGQLLPELIARMPQLQELRLFARYVNAAALFSLSFPHLRTLQVYHLHDHATGILAGNASLKQLATLRFHGHASDPCYHEPGPYLTLDDLRAVVQSPHLKSLKHLQFRVCGAGDEGCQLIASSGILHRLEVLDLKHGRITHRGATILAESPQLRNLKVINLARNALTARSIELLEATGVKVIADEQHAPSNEDWLYEGDWE